jgi:hypothetical protein
MKSSHDWLARIMEILDRFFKLGILKDYRGDIMVDCNEGALIEYRNLLLEEKLSRKKSNQKLFCFLDDGIFYLNNGRSQRPLALNFSTARGNNQVRDLMEILFNNWRESYINSDSLRCIIPKVTIHNQMKRRGYNDFTAKQLSDAKNYLKKKLETVPEINKHITILIRNDSFVFEITPVAN